MRQAAWFFRPVPRLAGLLLAAMALAALSAGVSLAGAPSCHPPLTERQRYGFVATSANWPQEFNVDLLGAGWYVTPSAYGKAGGMDRALLLGTYAGYHVNPATLGPLVDANPGSLWLIGNEPDCIWQDNVRPEEYARIYNDLYHFIKDRDRTSQIAVGGIVQPTPLRLQYLNRVLASYRGRYGRAMPVDLWNIHNAILREMSCDYDPEHCWGAEIPPGIEADFGEIRDIQDNDNMAIFESQIWAFRQWMADHGYGGYPLIVSEYGILMPEMFGFHEGRVNAFMSSTFDFFSSATDPALGDPNDGYRLVQRWAWFSLDSPPYNLVTGEGFDHSLFQAEAKTITAIGQHYASHTASFPPLEYVDLGFATWDVPSPSLVTSPTQTITYSLRARIVNRGTVDSGPFTVTLAYDGPVSGTLARMVVNLLPISSQWVSYTLTDLQAGGYSLSLEIDPDGQVDEAADCNNTATRTIVVPTHRAYLPLVLSQRARTLLDQKAVRSAAGSGSLDPGRKAWADPRSGSSVEPPGLGSPLTLANSTPGFLEFEMRTEASYPAQIALDPVRRVLWITERDGNKIECFDLQSGDWCYEQEFDAPTPDSLPWGLAVDGEGNVWFAESGADQIGKLVVASSTITEYGGLSAGSEPWEVAIGADGTVWFTEKNGNAIGKLEPATGQITEYPVPMPDPGAEPEPSGLALYGNEVWFTQSGSDRIGVMYSSTGDFEAVTRPQGIRPQDVVVTSGGNLWFTEAGANRIVRLELETSFWVREVDLATPDSEPYGIAMEGDVAVWFTERAGNKLGRYTGITPPREYSLPEAGSLPTGIVVQSEGCAWYTAPGANLIGRFCVPPPTYTYLPLLLARYTQTRGR